MSHGPRGTRMTREMAEDVFLSHDMLPLVAAIGYTDGKMAELLGEEENPETAHVFARIGEILPASWGPPHCLDAIVRAVASRYCDSAEEKNLDSFDLAVAAICRSLLCGWSIGCNELPEVAAEDFEQAVEISRKHAEHPTLRAVDRVIARGQEHGESLAGGGQAFWDDELENAIPRIFGPVEDYRLINQALVVRAVNSAVGSNVQVFECLEGLWSQAMEVGYEVRRTEYGERTREEWQVVAVDKGGEMPSAICPTREGAWESLRDGWALDGDEEITVRHRTVIESEWEEVEA